MFCSTCGNRRDGGEKFCRKCGTDVEGALLAPVKASLKQNTAENLTSTSTKDPDELIGNGIGSVFVGDGFFLVAVILSATQSSINSLLWLLLLIPAFFFFGKGFADVLYGKQIQKRLKQVELNRGATRAERPGASNLFSDYSSGKLLSVTERTTRNLE